MFIVVTGAQHRIGEIPAYLYSGQTIVTEPVENFNGSYMVVVDTGTADTYSSEYLRDRISSGMFGSVLFETLEEAKDFVESNR